MEELLLPDGFSEHGVGGMILIEREKGLTSFPAARMLDLISITKSS